MLLYQLTSKTKRRKTHFSLYIFRRFPF